MTKSQALEAMKNGQMIRYHSWWWGRFIRKAGTKLVDESGKPFAPSDILTEKDGWEVYDEEKHGKHHEKAS